MAGLDLRTTAGAGKLLYAAGASTTPDVVNSAAETTLATYTILASDSALAPNALRFKIGFDYLNNSGGAVNYTFNYKLGGTTQVTYVIAASNNASRISGSLLVDLLVVSTSEQTWDITHLGTAAGGAQMSVANSLSRVATSAVDMTSDRAFAVTVTMATANALTDFRTYGAMLTRIR